jgi:hypothetical protein
LDGKSWKIETLKVGSFVSKDKGGQRWPLDHKVAVYFGFQMFHARFIHWMRRIIPWKMHCKILQVLSKCIPKWFSGELGPNSKP